MNACLYSKRELGLIQVSKEWGYCMKWGYTSDMEFGRGKKVFSEGGRKEGVLLVIGMGRGREEEGLLGILGGEGGRKKEMKENGVEKKKRRELLVKIGEEWVWGR